MKRALQALAALGAFAGALGSIDPREPKITGAPSFHIAAIIPTESGQIGINPPPPESVKGHIGKNTKYLTDLGTSTKWIGPNPSFITVATKTATKAGKPTVATITMGVGAAKNAAGGLDILLSPAVKAKLEAIAKQVKPCSAKRRRGVQKRQGQSCGLADFVNRVGEDAELRDTFTHQITDEVWAGVDEGYSGGPDENPGFEHVHDDEGYFSDDPDGFFEGAEGDTTVEAVVFSSEEEAAAIAAAAAGSEAGSIFGASTVTSGSFLALLWTTLQGGKALDQVYQVPKESIHKITKTKTKTKGPSTTHESTTTSSTCPTGTKVIEDPKKTRVPDWKCSEGKTKGCKCNPPSVEFVTPYFQEYQQTIWAATKDLHEAKPEVRVTCDSAISNAPSKWFGDITKNFCPLANKSELGTGSIAYDVYGNKIPLLKNKVATKTPIEGRSLLYERTPPEYQENYKDYKFFVSWEPAKGDCVLPKDTMCVDAYKKAVQTNCGSNHGSAGDRLFVDTVIDVGCGKYTWHVEAPRKPDPKPDPPKAQDQVCTDKYSHPDVPWGAQETWADIGCRDYSDTVMKPGDKPIYWHSLFIYFLNYQISWVDGCDIVKEQSAMKPLGKDDSLDCKTLMVENYQKCNNGGAGGSRQVGCLKYEFYPKN
ncbi:hypothetical protein PLIIFM63780_004933 [Purpureocillium lilacinum]|nr:hypothetical protein PLIIFM63780_004933 [Purpureocillium lilacinum]